MSLHTGSVGDDGAVECTGGSYVRKEVAFDVSASGATQNTGAVAFTGMLACTVQQYGIWSAPSGGSSALVTRGASSIGSIVLSGEALTEVEIHSCTIDSVNGKASYVISEADSLLMEGTYRYEVKAKTSSEETGQKAVGKIEIGSTLITTAL